jgi:hypothetical protein
MYQLKNLEILLSQDIIIVRVIGSNIIVRDTGVITTVNGWTNNIEAIIILLELENVLFNLTSLFEAKI